MTGATRRLPWVCECGDHAFAVLTKGFVALVSPQDAHFFISHNWCATVCNEDGYVAVSRTARKPDGGKSRLTLAREILAADPSEFVDHADQNTMDNRRGNIRIATRSQNNANRKATSKCGLKGVRRQKRGRFYAEIKVAGKNVHLGSFDTPEAAHAAFCVAAKRLHGEFARTE